MEMACASWFEVIFFITEVSLGLVICSVNTADCQKVCFISQASENERLF